MCRVFRKEYKWSCMEVDDVPLKRLMRIYNETIEDAEKRNEELESL